MKRQTMGKSMVYIGVISLLFLLVLVFGIKARENKQLYFTLESDAGTVKIIPFEEDGKSYVFLPSYADFSKMRMMVPAGKTVTLGTVPVSNGMYCDMFQLQVPYELLIGDVRETELIFLQSENIAAMHIDTASGSMASVHRDKENKEEASVRLYGQDGMLQFWDAGSRIKGRGNYTWSQEKKPYSLELSYEGDLLGMGSSSEWTLLANVADASNLNNKLVLDLANQCFPEWSPECEFVDLYLNGEYAGLYLLTERIGTGQGKLELDMTAGEFLCRIDYPGRYDIIENPLVTQAGRVAFVSEPRRLSDTEKNRIAEQIQLLENLILSGEDLSDVEWFDLGSWVRRYLIDEISLNLDSDMASSFFYWKDGVFYAGPVWDYDVCFGNRDRNRNPGAFYARTLYKTEIYQSLYYDALYNNPSFYAEVRSVYSEELLPLLEHLVETGIDQLADLIEASAQMDNIRWKALYEPTFSTDRLVAMSPEAVRSYLEKRVEFLNSAWIDGITYYTLEFNATDSKVFSVKEGQLLETEEELINTYTWMDIETGEIFDPQQPVTRDLYLQVAAVPMEEPVVMEQPAEAEDTVQEDAVPEEELLAQEDPAPVRTEISTRLVIMVVSVVLMAGVFVCLVVRDWKNHPRKKEYVHE